MKEIQEILKKISNFTPGEKAILATVVDVIGSGYRRPGARMLIDENGYSIGTVSGGCLEADVLERAKKVLQTGEPTVITYDTTRDENSVFGLSMGCRGIVRILLEKTVQSNVFYQAISNVFRQRKPIAVASLVSSKIAAAKIGIRLFLDETGIIANDFDEILTGEILSPVKKNFAKSSTNIVFFSFGEVFIETFQPPLNLIIFGAGFDALPLIRFAKEVGWRVTAIDHRAAFANTERLPAADEIIVAASEDLSDKIFSDENSAAVMITHNYERDREILRRLLNSKCQYIGALGPKIRTENLLAEIGANFSREQLKKLYAPVGLDIGGDSPETIALAIVAEINSVLNKRDGGFLRGRTGSIYGRD